MWVENDVGKKELAAIEKEVLADIENKDYEFLRQIIKDAYCYTKLRFDLSGKDREKNDEIKKKFKR